jgi:hypothetical protein
MTFVMLVIDEASQIAPVDALGAVARCSQIVRGRRREAATSDALYFHYTVGRQGLPDANFNGG